MTCECCGGTIPERDVWEARRDEAGECDGSVDARTGRCRAWVSDDLWGLPCECSACHCDEWSTTMDDGGVPVCDACSCYTVDDDGVVHCSQSDDLEAVVETCGAGGQTRSYYRLRPPQPPVSDPAGLWATWWETVGEDSHLVDRYATREDAEQAVASYDWPRPGDHTDYLCGYGVRTLVDEAWVRVGTEDEEWAR